MQEPAFSRSTEVTGTAGPDAVQDDGDLACHGDLGLHGADPLREAGTPGFQGRPGSASGGERAAIIYTLAETAKLNGLNPEAYIAAVLDRLAQGHPINRLDDLLPWKLLP